MKVKIGLGFKKITHFVMHSAVDRDSWGLWEAVHPHFQAKIRLFPISGGIHRVILSVYMP